MFINNREILKAHNERVLASDLFSIDNRKPWIDFCVRRIITQTYRKKLHDFMLCHALIALSLILSEREGKEKRRWGRWSSPSPIHLLPPSSLRYFPLISLPLPTPFLISSTSLPPPLSSFPFSSLLPHLTHLSSPSSLLPPSFPPSYLISPTSLPPPPSLPPSPSSTQCCDV